jgi:hypothetical protein
MSDPAPEWRIVHVAPNEAHPLSAAVAAALNDNSAAGRRLRAKLEAALSRVLRERGVRVPGGSSEHGVRKQE